MFLLYVFPTTEYACIAGSRTSHNTPRQRWCVAKSPFLFHTADSGWWMDGHYQTRYSIPSQHGRIRWFGRDESFERQIADDKVADLTCSLDCNYCVRMGNFMRSNPLGVPHRTRKSRPKVSMQRPTTRPAAKLRPLPVFGVFGGAGNAIKADRQSRIQDSLPISSAM